MDSKYFKISKLGEKGKEGTTFLVIDKKGKEYAMKTFKKSKSSKNIEKEFKLQKKAYKEGVAPKPIEFSKDEKWIVMEKMDSHLFETVSKLSKKQQERILEIFRNLDKAKVLHNDANLQNYMIKKEQIYLIDYGMAKPINSKLVKTLNTETPNFKLMLIGFIVKLRMINAHESNYKYLIKKVSKEDLIKYNLVV